MIEDVTVYLLRYWEQVAKTQAFALRSPGTFRRAVMAIQEPSVSNTVALLLLAADATGVHLPEGLRSGLLRASKQALQPQ